MKARIILFALLISGAAPVALAQIYKYEDKDGWHFTDKPPPGVECELVNPDCPSPEDLPTDLATHLTEKTEPHTALERVANSVVRIDTKGWFGSGFFVSAEGHIITNRHVIRPVDYWQINDMMKKLDEHEELFRQAKLELDMSAAELDEAKRWLSDHRSRVEAESTNQKELQKIEKYEKSLRDSVARHRKAKRNYAQAKRKFDNIRWDVVMTTSAALRANRFQITLRDGTKLSAKLLSISKEWDLAVLKVDKHTTPFISAGTEMPHLGDKVIAIGNSEPIGTALTSGMVSSLDSDVVTSDDKDISDDSETSEGGEFITFDAQVVAGNSGGPLVNENGEVLGVITLKYYNPKEISTFGIAIPVKDAREFWDEVIEGGER